MVVFFVVCIQKQETRAVEKPDVETKDIRATKNVFVKLVKKKNTYINSLYFLYLAT
uniref:Uncharacterized protein n=1 Tax=Anguilla anguilla TaxID=7936 RepID=A0A0E9XSD0_ANGAN